MPTPPRVHAIFSEPGYGNTVESILLVEDEAFVREVTAEVLSSAGYTVVIARSGAEALEIRQKFCKPINLLFADMVMPGMSGIQLAAEFSVCHPRARVLLTSGYAEQLARCSLSSFGHSYLAKPFSMQSLLKKVRAVLDAITADFSVEI